MSLDLELCEIVYGASGPKFVIAKYDSNNFIGTRKSPHVCAHISANMCVCVSVDDACVRFGLGVVCLKQLCLYVFL